MKGIISVFLFISASLGAMGQSFVNSKFVAEKQIEQQAVQQAALASNLNSSLNFNMTFSPGKMINTQNVIVSQTVPDGLSQRDELNQQYFTMHADGEWKKLKKKLEEIKAKIDKKSWYLPMLHEKAQKVTLEHLLSTPAMKLLETVQTGTLAEAQNAIRRLQVECNEENLERQANRDVKNFTEKHVQAAYELLRERADFEGCFINRTNAGRVNLLLEEQSVATNSTSNTVDVVSTFVDPVTNISKEVDAKIQATLNELKDQYPDSQQYMQAIGSVLQNMKDQGLLTPTSEVIFTTEVLEAITHGVKHFVKEFKLDDPRENPREFVEAVIKYGIYATFHIMTDCAFLGVEKLAVIGTQVHALLQTDFSSMNAKQKAEFIAERVAEIIKMALADHVGRKIIPKAKVGLSSHSSSTSSTREVHEAVTPEGLKIGVSTVESDTVLFKKTDEKVLEVVTREQVLDRVKTYEQARKKALEIIGEVDVHSKKPHIGKQGICENKIVGTDWHGEKVILRLDHDLVKGPHINVTDYRMGKGVKGISIAIPFEGDLSTVNSLLKHLNTRANLEQAKMIFESLNDRKLTIIIEALKNLEQGL